MIITIHIFNIAHLNIIVAGMLPNVVSSIIAQASPMVVDNLHNTYIPTGAPSRSPTYSPTEVSATSLLQVCHIFTPYFSSYFLFFCYFIRNFFQPTNPFFFRVSHLYPYVHNIRYLIFDELIIL